MIETLFDLPTPAQRVARVEFVRRSLWQLRADDGEESVDDLPLSGSSTTWLGRMRAALVDEQVSQASFRDLLRAFGDYLLTLTPRDAGELNRRVREFDQTKQAILEVCR